MSKDDLMRFSGTVDEVLPNAMFRIVLDNEQKTKIENAPVKKRVSKTNQD